MRLHRPTWYDPDATSWKPRVQYIELFAGAGALSIAAEARGGEIAMLTENEPNAQANLWRRFPGAEIIGDIGDSSPMTMRLTNVKATYHAKKTPGQ